MLVITTYRFITSLILQFYVFSYLVILWIYWFQEKLGSTKDKLRFLSMLWAWDTDAERKRGINVNESLKVCWIINLFFIYINGGLIYFYCLFLIFAVAKLMPLAMFLNYFNVFQVNSIKLKIIHANTFSEYFSLFLLKVST